DGGAEIARLAGVLAFQQRDGGGQGGQHVLGNLGGRAPVNLEFAFAGQDRPDQAGGSGQGFGTGHGLLGGGHHTGVGQGQQGDRPEGSFFQGEALFGGQDRGHGYCVPFVSGSPDRSLLLYGGCLAVVAAQGLLGGGHAVLDGGQVVDQPHAGAHGG